MVSGYKKLTLCDDLIFLGITWLSGIRIQELQINVDPGAKSIRNFMDPDTQHWLKPSYVHN